MDLKKLNQPVKLDDIDFRVQSINNGGYATILAYKDARYDMNMLDEVVGTENWQKDFKIIDGSLYCGVGINVGTQKEPSWVWKWDVGTESDVEKAKGQASDSFKRACFNWGIGRELYSFPKISVLLNADEMTETNGKKRQSFKLKLSEWKWTIERGTDNKIIRLVAHDQNGKQRFDSNPSKPATKTSSPAKSTTAPPKQESAAKASNGAAITDNQKAALRGIVMNMKPSPEKQKLVDAVKEGKINSEHADEIANKRKEMNDSDFLTHIKALLDTI